MKLFKSIWFKVLLGIFVVSGIFIVLRILKVDFSQTSQEDIKQWVESLGILGPVVYIVVYIIRPFILLPAAIYSASAGVIWGLKGFIYVQIGANLSAIGEFLIARYLARQAIESKLKGKIAKLDQRIEKHGFLTVLLVRLVPNVAWDIQNLSLGLTKVKFRDYFLATLIGIMPASFALVYGGEAVIRTLTEPKNIWMLLVAIIIFSGVFYLQKVLAKKHKVQS